jgi:uncharacterized membrane protein HdeD (DUF308 family)
MALGAFFILLGTVGLGMTFAFTMAGVLLFGIFALIGGIVQLANAFQCKGWKSIAWHVLLAFLYLAAGAVIVLDPVLASTVFTAMLAGAFVLIGATRILMAIQLKGRKGWVWLLLAGALAVLLGGFILAYWPFSGFWVIGLLLAIEMIFHGWSYVLISLAARKAAYDAR